jgi:type I restriction enzyme S subunit
MSSELRRLWEQAGGKIPDDWKIVPFESLFRDNKSIAVGVMYPGPNTTGGAPLLKVGDIKDGIVPERPSYCISAATNEEHKRTQLVGDELLITLVGNPGECVVATRAMAGWNPVRAIAVVRLRDTCLRTYLKTVLESTPSRHLIDAVLNTTVQKTLNLKDVRQLPIPLPSKLVIEEISSIADSLIQRIALLRETNATLEAIAQAMFKSWFVDFDPVRAKQQGSAPEGMSETTAALFPDSFEESELGLLPKGWKVGKVADIGEVICGKTPPTSEAANYGDDVPFITIPDMHDFLVITSTSRSLSILGANTQKKKTLPDGSICVSCIATAGLVTRVTTPSQTNQQINSVVPLAIWGKSFPLFTLRRIGDAVRAGGSGGSVFHNLNKSGFEQLKVLFPSEQLTIEFDEIVEPIIEKITANQLQAQTLSNLRDTLLPRLISGQLRLSETNGVCDAC